MEVRARMDVEDGQAGMEDSPRVVAGMQDSPRAAGMDDSPSLAGVQNSPRLPGVQDSPWLAGVQDSPRAAGMEYSESLAGVKDSVEVGMEMEDSSRRKLKDGPGRKVEESPSLEAGMEMEDRPGGQVDGPTDPWHAMLGPVVDSMTAQATYLGCRLTWKQNVGRLRTCALGQ